MRICSKYHLDEVLNTDAGKKKWRKIIASKLQPPALREDIEQRLHWINEEGVKINTDNVYFYEVVKARAIEHESTFRLYKQAKEKSVASTSRLSFKKRLSTSEVETTPKSKFPKKSKFEEERERTGQIVERSGSSGPICWACKGPHLLNACKSVNEFEKKKIVMQNRKTFAKDRKLASMMVCYKEAVSDMACFQGVYNYPMCLDSGAYMTAVPKSLISTLKAKGKNFEENKLDEPVILDLAVKRTGGAACATRANSTAILDIEVTTKVGPVLLRNVSVLIVEGCLKS